jgi:mono/diheme cytochrome c family protein
MLRKLVLGAMAAAIFGLAVFWVLTIPRTVEAGALPARTPNLDNGREMFFAGGCAACHAPKDEEDRTRLGGGEPLKSPFGTFYPPNISPDPNDGIGRWTEAQFLTAMTKGTSPGGQHYYPAFPYATYAHMGVDDARDIFAYLRTLPAVQVRAPAHEVPFPFNIRRLVGGWKLLFLDEKPFSPDPAQSAAWNRGAYLVNAAAHCAECHSPRNIVGGIKSGQRFAGGPDLEGKGWVPNITQKGLSDWSDKDIAYMLETGQTPDGDSVGGAMTAVVRNTSRLTEGDRAAIATYIKSLPPVDGPPRPAKTPPAAGQ